MPVACLYHVQMNVSDASRSLPFYRDFFAYMGYRVIAESPEHLGVRNGTTDFWLMETEKEHRRKGFHRKATGLNHLAFRVSSKQAVKRFAREFLEPRGIQPLYASPKHFPEYVPGYYAVFFEDPDRIKLEVTYIPPSGKRQP